ncbi:hypothetical protein ABC766_05325 [Methylobacterium fujisawaense]|uniref:flagellin N-terminal helical domain-containing protein n=1 Tax=Methylobacterium fujisawaense TaxID=107400 RepID=UPI0031F4C58B
MSAITLSAPMRASLLAIQDTYSSLAVTQNRLATGRSVNSALDNPTNFFTASSLNSRSTSLASLVDGVANGIQATNAATKGIDAMKQLLRLATSMIDRAARSPSAVQTPAAVSSLGNNYTSADVVGAQNATAPRTSAPSDPAASSSYNMGLTGRANKDLLDFSSATLVPGDTITVSQGGAPQTYTYRSTGPNAGTNYFSDPSELILAVTMDFAIVSPGIIQSDKVQLVTEDTTPLSITSSNSNVQVTTFPSYGPNTFTYTTAGGTPQTFTFHKPANPATDPANGYFSDRTSLVAAINAVSGPDALIASIDPVTNTVRLTAPRKDLSFSLSGTNLASMGYGAQPYEPGPSLDDTQVTYSIGKGSERKSVTISYGYASNETTSLQQLNQQLATADMVAVLDSGPSGKLVVKPIAGREADEIELTTPASWVPPSPQVANGVTTLTGSISGQYAVNPVLSEPGASMRRQLAKEYTDLRTQLTGLARDSHYNGQNLLMGGDVKFQFNDTNSSQYTITGSVLDADSIGFLSALDGEFLDSQSTDLAAKNVKSALVALNDFSSRFVAGLTTANIRQSFNKSIGNILQTGADNLTLADLNRESVSVNSLNVRNQLTTSALGLAGQSQKQILQLLQA